MDDYKRMIEGLIYDPSNKEIMKIQVKYLNKLYKFNKLKPLEFKKKEKYMKEVFENCGSNCYIELPFRANWGGKNLSIGNNFYANFNLTLVDDGKIKIGNNVLIGPNVTIATACHPIDIELRKKAYQYNKNVIIGDNVWIGANAVILPGVKVGNNSIIGAGSVVTKDVDSNSIVAGNPAKLIRKINENDKKYFDHDRLIDYENMD